MRNEARPRHTWRPQRLGHMKILLVNTSETAGGAAIAARRLMSALHRQGVEARMLVRDGSGRTAAHTGGTVADGGGRTAAHTGGAVADGGGRTAAHTGAAADGGGRTAAHTGAAGPAVVRAPFPMFRRLPFLWERLCIWVANGLSRRNLWRVDIANAGLPITRTAAFREADVVHLHWVNQGFLSLAELRRILQSGKRVVWTMHDMWPCTAICHHAGTCQHYHTHCHDCPLLVRPGRHDLAYRVFGQKQKAYRHGHIDFVTFLIGTERRSSQCLKVYLYISCVCFALCAL